MDLNAWVPPLLSFLAAMFGAYFVLRYARRKAFEEALGGVFARRRLEVIERITCLLDELIDISSHLDGAPGLGHERDSAVVLAEFARTLPLTRIYLAPELSSLLHDIHFWVNLQADPHSGYLKPKTEPDYARTWKLLSEAAHGSFQEPRG